MLNVFPKLHHYLFLNEHLHNKTNPLLALEDFCSATLKLPVSRCASLSFEVFVPWLASRRDAVVPQAASVWLCVSLESPQGACYALESPRRNTQVFTSANTMNILMEARE